MKRGKGMSNRTLYTLISAFIIITAAFVVYAAAPKTVNPGHTYDQVYLGPINITGDAGNVGIGTGVPTQRLHVFGNITASQNVFATAFFYSSDRILKTNIRVLEGALDKVLQLQGVSFDWKETGEPSIGLIAQDVEKVYPEAVSTSAEGIKSIDYSKLVAVLIEAVKEQQVQIDALEQEVAELKAK